MCKSFGGASVVGTAAYLPCTDGPRAITIDADGTSVGAAGTPRSAASGSPTVGGGAVWVPDYNSGTLYALASGDGHVWPRSDVGQLPHFASPTLSGHACTWAP